MSALDMKAIQALSQRFDGGMGDIAGEEEIAALVQSHLDAQSKEHQISLEIRAEIMAHALNGLTAVGALVGLEESMDHPGEYADIIVARLRKRFADGVPLDATAAKGDAT